MIDADRVLRPLREAGSAIEALDTYESPAALTDALRATWHAVDRTLRAWLRSDPESPDELRLAAMSADRMSTDAVVTELRRRDLVSLQLAGRVHELRQAVDRAESGTVRASDADSAQSLVHQLEAEVNRTASRPAEQRRPAYGVADPVLIPADPEPDADMVVTRGGRIGLPSRPVLLAAAAGLVLIVALIAVVFASRESPMEQGITAFRENRMGVAEQHFRTAIGRDDGNVTARLYLARILRGQGRNEEAAQVLRAAAGVAPRDAAVRRELGYLFVALDRPDAAVQQFQQAVELDAAEPLNWVGLIESLRRANDPRAEEAFRRAPAAAQDMIRTRGG